MTKLALVRDRYLNLHDIGNYYGLTKLGVELLLCGTSQAPWEQIMEMYPLATPVCYTDKYEVFHSGPDVIDVPDAFYEFSRYFVERFEKTVVVTWENLPGKVSLNPQALETLRKAWKVTARSKLALRTDVHMHGIPTKKIRCISGAIDIESFFPAEERDDQKTVLFVGRMTQEKGLLDVIWAISRIPDAKLYVIGDGDFGLYKKLADHYAPGQVDFRGFIPRKELPFWYQKAKVFCAPSMPLLNDKDPYGQWLEQFGQVYLEAMACGIPIVAYDQPVLHEILGTDYPAMPPARDWCALSDGIKEVLNMSDEMWKEESRLARWVAENQFSQEIVAGKIKDWYEL